MLLDGLACVLRARSLGPEVMHVLPSATSHPRWLPAADGGKWQYTVALPDRIVTVAEHILAPDFEEGDSVLFTADDGSTRAASVIRTDAFHWCGVACQMAGTNPIWQSASAHKD